MGTEKTDLAWGVVRAWGKILAGRAPTVSIELTGECPLRCPGCYAYNDEHLGGGITLRQVRDFKGQELIDGVLALVRRHRPVHVSIIGGEPLVRYRELDELLPRLADMGIHTQVVTSAVRPIPAGWARVPRLNITVSIDGLQPEHDARRAPATYARILKHIAGRRVTVHCTVTRQQVRRDGYIEEFLQTWSAREEVKRIWISLYTPQVGEISDERLTARDRERVVAELHRLRPLFAKLDLPEGLIRAYAAPPAEPATCTFARTTACYSADLATHVTPCQLGGRPDCANCGCVASAALEAVAQHRLPGSIRVGSIFEWSMRVGTVVNRARHAIAPRGAAPDPAAAPSD
ncbi:MAG TPA: radical SAM protein [Vicinamibacterales bacterium]|nr:radical SAM protein [Vicinamibacterales bacterium]